MREIGDVSDGVIDDGVTGVARPRKRGEAGHGRLPVATAPPTGGCWGPQGRLLGTNLLQPSPFLHRL